MTIIKPIIYLNLKIKYHKIFLNCTYISLYNTNTINICGLQHIFDFINTLCFTTHFSDDVGICARSLERLNSPVIPRVANGSLSTECLLIELPYSTCSARFREIIWSNPSRTSSLNTCYRLHFLVFLFIQLRW